MIVAKHLYKPAVLTAALGIAVLAAGPALAKDKLTGEQQLAKLLEGRVAEKPVNCIPLFAGHDNTTVIDKTAIVYGWGSVIYVNRPTNADSLDSDDILVSHPTSGQECSLDTIQLRDRSTHSYHGFVGLQQFVPWRRVAKPK
jgi:hypothetical protein